KQGTTVEIVPSELALWMERIEAGEYLIADATAQAVAALAAPPEPLVGGSFLEVGSGRGTKTVLLQHNALRAFGAQLPLFALDLHAFKQGVLEERAERYGLQGVTPVVGDATRLGELVAAGTLPASFGGALIDAPCSGTGTLRRHPEIRWRLAPEEATAMAAQGLAMLRAVAPHIAPGGSLTYSTCSVLAEENERVVEAFLASPEGASFEVQPLNTSPTGSAPYLRTTLTPNSPDAHFAARLLKE
ncbi:MAG: hypothetical protein LBC23_05555, partial [Coriobacteriales bacterium]|nr:hypothetical protein [Coriobacteriales bacterium]